MAVAPQTIFTVRTLADVAELVQVSPKQLKYLLYGRNPLIRYRTFEIPKRRGGSRTISAPKRELKYIQRVLSKLLYEVYQPRDSAHGFCPGKSILTNAELHCQSRYIFNVDIKDFFPSINFGRVRGLFMKWPFSLPPAAATVLAQICCHNNVLPQGSPVSPILSNMIAARMDGELMRLAHAHGCLYTRYVDDITFSKRRADFPPDIGYIGPARAMSGPELVKILQANGFQVNPKKVYLQSNRRKQRVTGLIVNKSPNVPRRFVRQIRAMIHAWSVYGEKDATKAHSEQYYRRTGRISDPPSIELVIRGKLDFLKMVKGFADPVYRNLQSQFVKVCPSYFSVMQKENAEMSSRDVFISHASEDKEAIAKPLADALIAAGHSVWYDEYEIKLGDSLLDKMNEGLANARFGVVILSPDFFKKHWTKKELNGLAALESADGEKRILPVWHGLTHKEVVKQNPMLGALLAADASKLTVEQIVAMIENVL